MRSTDRSARLVRRSCPTRVRRIPEEQILNEHDIDSYIAKADAAPERLFAVLRTSLRFPQEIAAFELSVRGPPGAPHARGGLAGWPLLELGVGRSVRSCRSSPRSSPRPIRSDPLGMSD